MDIPFTTKQFFQVIIEYNSALFPVQIIILLAGLLSLLSLHSKKKSKDLIIGGFLGLLWIWIGIAYHLVHFTKINIAAYIFGFVFILQGFLFLIETFLRRKLEFRLVWNKMTYLAYFFILFGIIIYPILIYLLENTLESTITLGLPCPSTIFTFGFLMFANQNFSKYLLIIPALWTIIGTSAAFNFGVYPDLLMPISALAAIVYLLSRRTQTQK